MRAVTYREAVRDALAEELARDPSVFLLGEDVALGGVFNATPGLHDRFGPQRIIDTPISELAFTAAAFGAAVKGLRPVVEIMFADFLPLALDSLSNQASKYFYLSKGQAAVPLTVRTTVGAGARFSACHSETPTGWLLGLPGLKLVAPSNPADAKGLLKAAIRDDNPVVVFEHKMLYGRTAEVADGDDALVALGRAAVRRRGADVTLVAASRAVETALEAASHLSTSGIEATVLDLRTLKPLDADAIAEAAAATRRLVVVEESSPMGGYAAEVIALALERVGPLSARRVTMPDLPIPFSPVLEDAVIPTAPRVVDAARALVEAR